MRLGSAVTRLVLVGALALAGSGCDEDATGPQPMVPLAPSHRPAPETEPVAAAPAPAVAPLAAKPVAASAPVDFAPSASDLAADFDFGIRSGGGMSVGLFETHIFGDRRGARVEHYTVDTKTGQPPSVKIEQLDAKDVAALLQKLDALKPWALHDDGWAGVPSLETETVTLRRGKFDAQFSLSGGCACERAKPRPASCACAQSTVLKLLAAQHGTPVNVAAPTERKFKPAALKGRPQKEACRLHDAVMECGYKRCFKDGANLACFESPLPKAKATLVSPRWDKPEPKGHPKQKASTTWIWAVELPDGEVCTNNDFSSRRASFKCVDDAKVTSLFASGRGWVASETKTDSAGVSSTRSVPVKAVWH